MRFPENESSILEWKKEIPQNDQILKTIIGFCNHNGGKIVIGVSDNGEITGLAEDEVQKALESVEQSIYDASYPTIIPRIYTQRFGDKSVLIIEVSAGMSKPYFRKSEGLDKGTYVRIGRTTMKATPEMIQELKWQASGIDYETMANYKARKEDLDEKKIQYFLDHRKNKGRADLDDSVMSSYHLIVLEHSQFYPTQAGLLLFGKDPQHFLSEAMIICSHFEGNSGRNTIATIDCEGMLFDQFKQAFSFVLSRLSKSFQIHGPQRTQKLEIPEVAIREALLNALIHRNYFIKAPIKISIYDNRLEIYSPGSFPGPLNITKIKAGITYLRNPLICKIFREAGYVEKLGTGFISIFESYELEGLEDPQIIEGENFIKCILPREAKTTVQKTAHNELSKLFSLSTEISIDDVQQILGVSRQTASRVMNRLIKEGLVVRQGKARSTKYKLR